MGGRAQLDGAGLGDRRSNPLGLRRRLVKAHGAVVQDWIKKNPATPQPKSSDLAVVFFETFSNEHPGMFPSSVTTTGADGKSVTTIEPVKTGSDIQSIFFDMWRADHPDVALTTFRATSSQRRRPASTPTSRLRTPSSSSTAWRPSGRTTRS